jgi:uncharacterized protein YjbJ (UPF0337 family)
MTEVQKVMRENNDHQKLHGTLETIGSRIKRAFGGLMGHDRTEADGQAQVVRGDDPIRHDVAGEHREGSVQEAAGAVRSAIGDLGAKEPAPTERREDGIAGKEREEDNR